MEPNRFSENLNWDNAQIVMRLVAPEDYKIDSPWWQEDCNYVGTTVLEEKLAIMHDHAQATDPLGLGDPIDAWWRDVRHNLSRYAYWLSSRLEELGWKLEP